MILLVDDEKRRMRSLIDLLKEYGYRVTYCADVDIAFEVLQQQKGNIKAIILDIMMAPGKLYENVETELGLLTGCEFYKTARKVIGNNIPIIIHTALNRNETLTFLKREINCFVLKKSQADSFDIIRILEKRGVEPASLTGQKKND